MDGSKLELNKYEYEITKFGKEFAKKHMPNFNSEWLIIAFTPTPDRDDTMSQLSAGESIFNKVPRNSFVRQFVLRDGNFEERSVQDVQAGKPEVEGKKLLSMTCLNHKDYFRMDYDGIQYGDHRATGQGRQIDIIWDGSKFNPVAKSDHLVTIS